MWEKIRVVFTIPELRQKILLTLLLLAIYRVGWQIPLPIVDPTQMTAFFDGGARRPGRAARAGGRVQRQPAQPGHDLRPGHHALHLRLDHLPAPRQRLSAAGTAAEGRRERAKKINEYTRYATVVLCLVPELVLRRRVSIQQRADPRGLSRCDGALPFGWQLIGRADDDRRHDRS